MRQGTAGDQQNATLLRRCQTCFSQSGIIGDQRHAKPRTKSARMGAAMASQIIGTPATMTKATLAPAATMTVAIKPRKNGSGMVHLSYRLTPKMV